MTILPHAVTRRSAIASHSQNLQILGGEGSGTSLPSQKNNADGRGTRLMTWLVCRSTTSSRSLPLRLYTDTAGVPPQDHEHRPEKARSKRTRSVQSQTDAHNPEEVDDRKLLSSPTAGVFLTHYSAPITQSINANVYRPPIAHSLCFFTRVLRGHSVSHTTSAQVPMTFPAHTPGPQ